MGRSMVIIYPLQYSYSSYLSSVGNLGLRWRAAAERRQRAHGGMCQWPKPLRPTMWSTNCDGRSGGRLCRTGTLELDPNQDPVAPRLQMSPLQGQKKKRKVNIWTFLHIIYLLWISSNVQPGQPDPFTSQSEMGSLQFPLDRNPYD